MWELRCMMHFWMKYPQSQKRNPSFEKSTTINLLLFTECVIGHLPSEFTLTMYNKYTHKMEPSPPLLSPFSPLFSPSLPSPPLFLSCIHVHLPHRHWKLRCHLKSITMRTQKFFFFFVITPQWFSLSFTLKGLLPHV